MILRTKKFKKRVLSNDFVYAYSDSKNREMVFLFESRPCKVRTKRKSIIKWWNKGACRV